MITPEEREEMDSAATSDVEYDEKMRCASCGASKDNDVHSPRYKTGHEFETQIKVVLCGCCSNGCTCFEHSSLFVPSNKCAIHSGSSR
jgi:hypothetical protein